MRTLTLVLALGVLGACNPATKIRPPDAGWQAGSTIAASPLVHGILHEDATTVTATVQKIERQRHRMTLVRPDGTKIAIVAPGDDLFATVLASDVDDIDRFEKGDQVTLTYRESVAFEVKKPDQVKLGISRRNDATHAPRGEAPAGSVTSTVELRASITAIDEAASTVTIHDDHGEVALMSMPDPGALHAIVVGDVMDITYTVALAMTVQKHEGRSK